MGYDKDKIFILPKIHFTKHTLKESIRIKAKYTVGPRNLSSEHAFILEAHKIINQSLNIHEEINSHLLLVTIVKTSFRQ